MATIDILLATYNGARYLPEQLRSLETQTFTDWRLIVRDDAASLGAGIAAMPSMHVAQAFLFFLAMRHKPRWAATFFGAFALIVLVGSVRVGYHYAVDGYLAIILAAIVWGATGVFMRCMTGGLGLRERRRDGLA